MTHRNGFSKNYLPSSQKLFLFFHRSFHLDLLRMIDLCVEYHGISKLIRPLHWIVYLASTKVQGHLAALTRSHLIGDHPSGLIKEQTTETMDPSPKTKGLRPYLRQWNYVLVWAARLPTPSPPSCAPANNTASHNNHEKISSWFSFTFYGYGAPLGGLRPPELRYNSQWHTEGQQIDKTTRYIHMWRYRWFHWCQICLFNCT